jgi:lysozyme family protein
MTQLLDCRVGLRSPRKDKFYFQKRNILMTASSFDASLAFVLKYEGGYVNHPQDKGGPTNMGITHKTLSRFRGEPVTIADVKELTCAEAARIYRQNYWDEIQGDELPAGIDLGLFDFAVNAGPGRAIKLFQAVLNVTQDGLIGPRTLQAAQKGRTSFIISALCSVRIDYQRRLSSWRIFGRGWAKRVRDVERASLAMVKPPAGVA